jgi:flavin-binding protein dodecin
LIFRLIQRTAKSFGLEHQLPRHKPRKQQTKEEIMAKKDQDSVYKVVEVVGTSKTSWADAGRKAVETAAGSLRDLRIAEVVKLDMAIEKGKVRAYRARVALSFKIEG